MKTSASSSARVLTTLAAVCLLSTSSAFGQLPTTEERLKILTDPESVKAKLEKDRVRPPLEFFRSQVAPFDILPYVKANHWVTLSLEMRANHDDYAGLLQTAPVRLLGMPREGVGTETPQEVIYRRDARLVKEQRSRLGLQLLLPRVGKEIGLELTRPDAIRADEVWPASLRVLEPHQMLILVLTKDGSDPYARWSQLHAMIPGSADRGDALAVDRQRYYRLVLPLEPDQPPLSNHPLTWTTISHVIWDAMPPENLHPAHQQAMVDWLHWGGQLILIGGAKPSFAALRDSFLGPYLPADPTGENVLLNQAELQPLAEAYRPPVPSSDRDEIRPIPVAGEPRLPEQEYYLAPQPIVPASNRPVFVAGLEPRPGATVIPLGDSSRHRLGVEWRVGRGRVLMLGLNPTDPALTAWLGLDTLVRRVMLRRPEDHIASRGGWNGQGVVAPSFSPLTGPDLSWFRYIGRDLGAAQPRPSPTVKPDADEELLGEAPYAKQATYSPFYSPSSAVAEWVDSSTLPQLSRDLLEEASGISIPGSKFVLKVILAYIIALVPLNWLICRYVLGRREWAWVVVPTLSFAFAIGVERAAAYDLGYDAACDEIDVVETYGGYPRAHLSRFASLYSSGRVHFNVSYPNDPTALILPLDNGRSLRGEDVRTAVFQSLPMPALIGYQVQPRTLSLFRTEEMTNLAGAISLVTDGGPRRLVNGSEMELRDAVLIDVNGPNDRREIALGTIAPGATVEVKAVKGSGASKETKGQLNPERVLRELRGYVEDRPENKGEIRLVAWTPKVAGGQTIEPPVDRHRGFAAVVVHLRHGPAPAPDGPRYNYLAPGAIQAPVAVPETEMDPSIMDRGRGGRGRRLPAPPGMVVPPAQNVPARPGSAGR